jgi:hypothetical protein
LAYQTTRDMKNQLIKELIQKVKSGDSFNQLNWFINDFNLNDVATLNIDTMTLSVKRGHKFEHYKIS